MFNSVIFLFFSALCTPRRMLEFMGDISNGFAPFAFRFNYFDTADNKSSGNIEGILDPETKPCNEVRLVLFCTFKLA